MVFYIAGIGGVMAKKQAAWRNAMAKAAAMAFVNVLAHVDNVLLISAPLCSRVYRGVTLHRLRTRAHIACAFPRNVPLLTARSRVTSAPIRQHQITPLHNIFAPPRRASYMRCRARINVYSRGAVALSRATRRHRHTSLYARSNIENAYAAAPSSSHLT